jgi:hypothetical protein
MNINKFSFLCNYNPAKPEAFEEVGLSVENQKMMRLAETRHVSGYQFQAEISQIVNIIQTYLSSVTTDEYKFQQTFEDGSKPVKCNVFETFFNTSQDKLPRFDFIKTLFISVEIYDFAENSEAREMLARLNGEAQVLTSQTIEDNKIRRASINIQCGAVRGKLYRRGLMSVLYHELTHSFEIYNRRKHGKEAFSTADPEMDYSLIVDDLWDDDREISVFCRAAYILFFKFEINAIVSSIYGELKEMNSTSWKDDIYKTDTGKNYQHLCNTLVPQIEKMPLQSWQKMKPYALKLASADLSVFRGRVLKIFHKRLNMLFRKMCSAASLWYEQTMNTDDDPVVVYQNN